MEVLTGWGGRQQDEERAADSGFPERRGYIQVSWTVSLFAAGHSFYMYEEYLWAMWGDMSIYRKAVVHIKS